MGYQNLFSEHLFLDAIQINYKIKSEIDFDQTLSNTYKEF